MSTQPLKNLSIGSGLGNLLAAIVVIAALGYAPNARSAEIRITGPKVVAPGADFSLYVEARNDDVPGQLTGGIDFNMGGSGAVFTGPAVKPTEYDFFSDEDWNPVSTLDFLFQPPTPSGRGTWSAGDSPINKPFSNVASYPLQANAGATPFEATAILPDDDILFWDQDLSPQAVTNLNGSASPYTFIVGLRGDANCDGEVNVGDIAALALALVDPAAYEETGCFMELVDMNEDGTVDGRDIPGFVGKVIGG